MDLLSSEILKNLVEKVDKSFDAITAIDKKIDLHIQKTHFDLVQIQELDEQQNKLLAEHIAGVNTLRDMHEVQKTEVNARLEKLEEPRKLLRLIKAIAVWLVTVVGAVTALAGLLQLFKQ